MAIFGWGKKDAPGEAKKEPQGPLSFSPEKARAWFERARTVQDTGNHEYAMACWLSGLRLDPTNVDSLKAFFRAASEHGKAPSKDMISATSGKTDLDKYLRELLEWSCDQANTEHAIGTVEWAAKLGLKEPAAFMGPQAFALVIKAPKQRKADYLAMADVFEKCDRYDLAAKAAEQALRLDPSDAQLAGFVRNLAAQSTMNTGGFDQSGQEGGFRSNIRDADKQRNLDDQDRLSKNTSTIERVVEITKTEYEANPADKPCVQRYAKALLDRGTPDDEAKAIEVLTKAFTETQEFRFRMLAGEIRIRQAKRAMRPLQTAADANPADETARSALAVANKSFADLEIDEYQARATAYPTDLGIKNELGRRMFEAGRFNEAIELFQLAKTDGRSKNTVMSYLGRSFAAIGWHDEAIETFRTALEGYTDPTDAAGLELRYGLLCALQDRGKENHDLAAAEEAYKLASAIAVHQMGFKDIRTRRDQIKALVAQLKQPAPPAG